MKKLILLLLICTLCKVSLSQNEEMRLPVLFFKAKSLAFDTLFKYSDNTENITDTNNVINFITSVLKKNYKLKVILNGHSDFLESNDTILSYQRASKVKSILVDNGIDENRISINAEGCKRAYMSEKLIKKARNNLDKEKLRRYNRRVTFTRVRE